MKKICVLAMVLASFWAQAQSKQPTKKKPLLLSFQFSPDYANRTLVKKDGNAINDLIVNARNSNELAKLGYTFGLHLAVPRSQRLAFEVGIHYANKGYKTKNRDLVYSSPAVGLPTKAQFNYAYRYIGIPLQARLTLGNGAVRFVGGIGLQMDWLLLNGVVTKLQYADGRTEERTELGNTGFTRIDVSPLLNAGIEYAISAKTRLSVAPIFRYGTIAVTDTPISERLWSAGLNFGVHYVLR